MDMFIRQRPVSALILGHHQTIIMQETEYIYSNCQSFSPLSHQDTDLPFTDLYFQYIFTYLQYYGLMMDQAEGRNLLPLNKHIHKGMFVVIRDFIVCKGKSATHNMSVVTAV